MSEEEKEAEEEVQEDEEQEEEENKFETVAIKETISVDTVLDDDTELWVLKVPQNEVLLTPFPYVSFNLLSPLTRQSLFYTFVLSFAHHHISHISIISLSL